MSKYRLSYKKNDELQPINFEIFKELTISELEIIETMQNIDLTRIKTFKENFVKACLKELKSEGKCLDVNSYNADLIDKIFKEREINVRELKCNKFYDTAKLDFIDHFTTMFKNDLEILSFLKKLHLIPNRTNKLYISYKEKKNDKLKEYDYPEKIYYKEERKILSTDYVRYKIKSNMQNGDFIDNFATYYYNKYKEKYPKLASICNYICAYGRNIKYGYGTFTPSENNDYSNCIDKFITLQFYKKDKKDNYDINYKNIRDFICFINKEKTRDYKKNTEPDKKNDLEMERFIKFKTEEDDRDIFEREKDIIDIDIDKIEEEYAEEYEKHKRKY